METDNNQLNTGADHVPAQVEGSEMNAVEKIEMNTEAEAIHFFKTVKNRLLDVNKWTEISGGVMSEFFLTDASGNQVSRMATDGDHIKIDIPGPGTSAGGGFDWVTIEEIRSEVSTEAEVLSLTARPSSNPETEAGDTAHFLSEEATSTFQVKRIGKTIYAEEHGRNEKPNTDTDNTLDNLRNTFVGWGAKAGFSYPQWKALVKGLISNESKYHSS
jgi:hypothetical protein